MTPRISEIKKIKRRNSKFKTHLEDKFSNHKKQSSSIQNIDERLMNAKKIFSNNFVISNHCESFTDASLANPFYSKRNTQKNCGKSFFDLTLIDNYLDILSLALDWESILFIFKCMFQVLFKCCFSFFHVLSTKINRIVFFASKLQF